MRCAACDRLSKIAQILELVPRADAWRLRADAIHVNILQHAWSEQQTVGQLPADLFDGRHCQLRGSLVCAVG